MRHESLPETPLAYRLLEVLGKIPGSFLGAGELCERLVADREMLKEAVGALQRLGYHLEDHPAHGLSLRMEVDVLVQEEVEARLKTRALGRLLACHLEVGSTNDLATRAAQAGTAHGTVITAEHQTSGRGRLGRAWFSPPGCGLWFSVVLRPNLMLEQAWIVTLGAAVAAVDAVQAVTGLLPDVKWPNDLRLNGRKLAGILTEGRAHGARLASAVLGMGLNVNQDPQDFPPDLREIATSLKIETGRTVARSELLAAILDALETVYADSDAQRVRHLWKARTRMLGEPVRVVDGDTVVVGIAEDLAVNGALCVRVETGELVAVRVGDVQHVEMKQ